MNCKAVLVAWDDIRNPEIENSALSLSLSASVSLSCCCHGLKIFLKLPQALKSTK